MSEDKDSSNSWNALIGEAIGDLIRLGVKMIPVWGILHVLGSPF